MNGARWVMVLLLVGAIFSCLVLSSMVAINLFSTADVPIGRQLTPAEVLLNSSICMIVPVTLALSAAVVWWVFLRAPASPAPSALPAPPQARAVPYSSMVPSQPLALLSHSPAGSEADAQDRLLDEYITQLTELLMAHPAGETGTSVQVIGIVQARTRHVLQLVDARRRGQVLQMLHNAHFLRGDVRLNMHGIDLCGTDLRFADLRAAELSGVNLQRASLTGALLQGANLSGSNLTDADLRLARLDGAVLDHASLQRSQLHRARLPGARLHSAQLNDTIFWQADLRGAQVLAAQLDLARSLSGATMPDGSRPT